MSEKKNTGGAGSPGIPIGHVIEEHYPADQGKVPVVSVDIHQALCEPGLTWKERRAILRAKTNLSEEIIAGLVPENHPSDY